MNGRPKRSLGQNFLADPNYRRKIIAAARGAYAGGTVVEIGPGRGSLTPCLADFAERLVLVEKDARLAETLRRLWSGNPRVSVVAADFLDWELVLPEGGVLVVGNLPYNASTQILIRLLRHMTRFDALVLMFQKEVAVRILAGPGTKDYGPLALWSSLFARAERLFDVPPNAFRPRPRVVSSLLRFIPSGRAYDEAAGEFIAFARRLFTQRRKKLGTVLKAMGFREALRGETAGDYGRFLDARAETLSPEELERLYQDLADHTPKSASSRP